MFASILPQMSSIDPGSSGANNVDGVPSPAGDARHRASSVCSPQLLSLKASLLCQVGSEEGRSHCCNGRNQPVNLCGARSVCSIHNISNASLKHSVFFFFFNSNARKGKEEWFVKGAGELMAMPANWITVCLLPNCYFWHLRTCIPCK